MRARSRAARLPVLLSLIALSAPLAAQESPTPADGTEQRLRPGDVVRLAVWREPDFSGDFTVDRTGNVVVPRLGELRVVELSPQELERTLVDGYRRYLVNPSIEVTILRRVNVLGAVFRPGLYPVDPTVTLADVLALAGGVTPLGNAADVRLIRDDQVVATALGERTLVGESPIRSGDQIFVPERSWLSRNAGVAAAGITAAVTLLVALSR